jgi:hypothetical protein
MRLPLPARSLHLARIQEKRANRSNFARDDPVLPEIERPSAMNDTFTGGS